MKKVHLQDLPTFINDVVYTEGKYPCLVDSSGTALMFLKYRSRVLSVMRRGDMEPESLRAGVTQCMHNGGWLCLDFDALNYDVEGIIGPTTFPMDVFLPETIFLEDTYTALLRPTDSFAARILYEGLNNVQAIGAFQDRTKAHAPERVADVDSKFDPKESYRLVAICKGEPPAFLLSRMSVFEVSTAGVKKESAVWGGGEAPKEKRSPGEQKLDTEVLDSAFEGDLASVKRALERGADPYAVDGRGATAMSEAACEGHCDVVRFLLSEYALSDPNAQNHEGRTPLHRAAFHSRLEMLTLLLEAGADPRVKTRSGESPFDMAGTAEARALFQAWDVSKTEKLLEERRKLVEAEEERLVKDNEDVKRLRRSRQFAKMEEFIANDDKEGLDLALCDLQPSEVNTLRDSKGNSLLHVAAKQNKADLCDLLVDEAKAQVDSRDAKGWTPLMVAAFHDCKKSCIHLLSKRADPLLTNAYRKT